MTLPTPDPQGAASPETPGAHDAAGADPLASEPEGGGHGGDDAGNDEDEQEGPRPGLLHESLRRVLLGGASALLTTEEGIRSLIAERRLPKEALSTLLAQTDKTRRDVGKLIGRELKNTLGKVDVAGEIRRAMHGLRFDIQASIRVHDDSAPPGQQGQRADDQTAAPQGAPAPGEAAGAGAPPAADEPI